MTELEKYEAVNKCETFKELAGAIIAVSEKGMIKGRSKSFNAEYMANYCRHFGKHNANVLTRSYGIRQQALYINFYS